MISNKIELCSYYQIDALVVSVYFSYKEGSKLHKWAVYTIQNANSYCRMACPSLKYFLAALLAGVLLFNRKLSSPLSLQYNESSPLLMVTVAAPRTRPKSLSIAWLSACRPEFEVWCDRTFWGGHLVLGLSVNASWALLRAIWLQLHGQSAIKKKLLWG